jgi:hypothetical protein
MHPSRLTMITLQNHSVQSQQPVTHPEYGLAQYPCSKSRVPSPSLYKQQNPPQRASNQVPVTWREAARDTFSDMLDQMKSSLTDIPQAEMVWNDFLIWLKSIHTAPSFSRTSSIPAMEEKFSSLLAAHKAATDAAAESNMAVEANKEVLLEALSRRLAEAVLQITALEKDLEAPLPGQSRAVLQTEIEAAHLEAAALEEKVFALEGDMVPPTDPFADGDSYILVDSAELVQANPWPEFNWE